MQTRDSRAVLAENVVKLMEHHWGKVNIHKLGLDTGLMNGGVQRILSRAGVAPHLIDKVAKLFDLETWVLFVDGFNPAQPPPPYAELIKTYTDAIEFAERRRGPTKAVEEAEKGAARSSQTRRKA